MILRARFQLNICLRLRRILKKSWKFYQRCLQRKLLHPSKNSIYMKNNRQREVLVLYMGWRGMSMLYGAGSWIYRASKILEAIFHLRRYFMGQRLLLGQKYIFPHYSKILAITRLFAFLLYLVIARFYCIQFCRLRHDFYIQVVRSWTA